MARFGAFCFPGCGHLNPMIALAHALQDKGHGIVFFGIADTEASVRQAGLEFQCIGAQDFPPGTLRQLDEQLARQSGIPAFRFTLQRIRYSARMVLSDGPEAVQAANIDALLVDEAEFAGNVADKLGLPWISIALIPPLLHDDRFPPFWFGWAAGQGRLSRLRNRLATRLLLRFAAPLFRDVNLQRKAWGLKTHSRPEQQLSPLGQITQLPEALEFSVTGAKPLGLHYAGPFLHARRYPVVCFPWDRLDGRPLIYASLGTLQNGSEPIFKAIAAACAGLDAQLLISLGGGLDPAKLGHLAGNPLVVHFAPQLDILKRATLVITHAGLNTVLESLSEGLPLLALPLGNDQPGVAARLKARGACVIVSRRRLSARRLRKAIILILHDPKYRQAAQTLQTTIRHLDGTKRAVELIEQMFDLQSTHL